MTSHFSTEWNAALQTLYGAVVDEERYIDFLDRVQHLIGAKFMVMGMFDPHDPARHVHRFSAPRSIGMTGAMEFLGLAAQSHSDGSDNMLAAGPQRILLDVDVYTDRDELQQRPTMKLLHEKYDAQHIGTVNAQPNNAWVDYFMFAHNSADFDNPERVREMVSFLVPHIGVASEIRRAFKLLETRYQAIFSALNFLRYGVALVLDNYEVMLTNEAFDQIVDAGDGLRLSNEKRLAGVTDEGEAALNAGLKEAIAAAGGSNATFRKTVPIERRGEEVPYIVDLAPFCDDVAGELNMKFHGALVFIVDPGQPSLLAHEGISAAFSLTGAEERVCRQLLDGQSNAEIAEANSVALPTVKSQVASIFGKSNVTSRADLVRLASKITPPIVEPDEKG
ncbi:MAG: helix-turn-helix transcriptional regulator [Pseudomonadota bacterium]